MRKPDVCQGLSIKRDICSKLFARDVFSEFLATFFLMSVQSALPLSWGRTADFATGLQTGIGMGFIVATMAWSLGDFGGGHLNPAVTFAMILALKINIVRGVIYILAQCVGAIAGAAFIYAVTPNVYQEGLAATTLGPGVSPWQGYLTEAWITCILVTTIFGATNSERKNGNVFMPPLMIGLAICLGIMSAFVSTGGSMNPARSFGPAVVKGIWTDHWVYWAGPLTGASLAVVFYVAILDRIGKEKTDNRDGVDTSGSTELEIKTD